MHVLLTVFVCTEDLDLHKEVPCLVLTEGPVLGGGAFSRVSEVTEETTGNTYAMKRMRKAAVVQCPEHVYFEQVCVGRHMLRTHAHALCDVAACEAVVVCVSVRCGLR